MFFDWHLLKVDVNIDRVISPDFVPGAFPLFFFTVLDDCIVGTFLDFRAREAAAEAVGHLNLGIFAALVAKYWERAK